MQVKHFFADASKKKKKSYFVQRTNTASVSVLTVLPVDARHSIRYT